MTLDMRLPIALTLAVFLCAPSAAMAFAKQRPAEWSRADAADLDRVSAMLNTIHTMEGGFLQIEPSGQSDTGKFYVMKPGRIRFDYDPPSPTLVIGDGLSLAVYNTKLNTVNRYPLSSTPLNLLLSDNIDLKRSMAVIGVEHQPGELIVDARSTDRRSTADMSIVFSDPGLELRQWTIVDAQGLPTTISLTNVQQGVTLDAASFKISR